MKSRIYLGGALALVIVVACAVLVGCGDRARASVSEVAWSIATEYEDGSALPPEDIAGHLIQWGQCGGPYAGGSQLVAMPDTTLALPALPSGPTCFVAYTILTDEAATAKPAAKQSRATGEVRLVVPTVPGAPRNLRVQ